MNKRTTFQSITLLLLLTFKNSIAQETFFWKTINRYVFSKNNFLIESVSAFAMHYLYGKYKTYPITVTQCFNKQQPLYARVGQNLNKKLLAQLINAYGDDTMKYLHLPAIELHISADASIINTIDSHHQYKEQAPYFIKTSNTTATITLPYVLFYKKNSLKILPQNSTTIITFHGYKLEFTVDKNLHTVLTDIDTQIKTLLP